MSIKLSSEVKKLIRRTVSISDEQELKCLNSLALLGALLEDKTFAEMLQATSKYDKEQIQNFVKSELYASSFKEEEAKKDDDEANYFKSCLNEAEVENTEEVHFSQSLAEIMYYARIYTRVSKEKKVNLKQIALSMIGNPSDDLQRFFEFIGADTETLEIAYTISNCASKNVITIPQVLNGCVTVLNEKFKDNAECEILGRDQECNEIWKTMMKKTKRNVILKGEPGVGKSSIVYKITSEIVKGTCPEMFKNYTVLSLDVNNLISGTTYRGQAEERFKALIDMLKEYDNIILFIDEIHMIIGAGASAGNEKLDFSNALKPILAGDDAIIIGATTDEEYEKAFNMEGALKRRFRNITVSEPKTSQVYDMLKESIKQLEQFHGVKISKRMVDMIIFYSSCFNYTTSNPDRTKDLIDLSMVTAKMNGKERVDRESVIKNFNINFERFHKMSPSMIYETAYHEIGHFMVQRFSGRLVQQEVMAVSIIPTDDYLGVNVLDRTDSTANENREYFIDKIASLLAGKVSEKMFMNVSDNSGASKDLEVATKIAYNMVTKYGMTTKLGKHRIYLNDQKYQMQTSEVIMTVNEEIQSIIDEAYERAKQILSQNEILVKMLVDELYKKGMLSRIELEKLIYSYQKEQVKTN